jgi:LmbE family N-acetylglucosaminyl deacetylase
VSQTQLPPWHSVLAVVAHPDDESFGLGAVLAAFVEAGARVSVLCFTRGEASTLHGVEGDLTTLRTDELTAAAAALGLHEVTLLTRPDGRLPEVDLDELAGHVIDAAREVGADGLVGFDLTGVTGHPDHARASAAAVRAATALDLPVLGWTLPERVAEQLCAEYDAHFEGHAASEIDLVVTVDRATQLKAVECHPSQAVPGSVLWRRLELLGDREHLRWLRRGGPAG